MITNVNTDYGVEDHKKRTHRLIGYGGLVDAVGLGQLDAQLMTGLLLQSKAYLEHLNPAQCDVLRQMGDKFLSDRRAEKEKEKASLPKMG